MGHYATNAFAAKRAIVRAIAQRASEPGNPLTGWQVLYKALAGVMEARCIYGGGFTFDQPGEQDIVDGKGRIPFEAVIIAFHLVSIETPPNADDEALDITVEEAADEIAAMLARDPALAGAKSRSVIDSGEGDYSPAESTDETTLSLRIRVEAYVT